MYTQEELIAAGAEQIDSKGELELKTRIGLTKDAILQDDTEFCVRLDFALQMTTQELTTLAHAIRQEYLKHHS